MQAGTVAAAVLGKQFLAQGEQIFFVNEKWASVSGDDFTILDFNRQPVFKLDSSAISIKQKRVLKTIRGQAVCSHKKKASMRPPLRACQDVDSDVHIPCTFTLAMCTLCLSHFEMCTCTSLAAWRCPYGTEPIHCGGSSLLLIFQQLQDHHSCACMCC